ncbi:MAG: hypothetical protein ACM3YE_14640 [Bacteroidota bacterium]
MSEQEVVEMATENMDFRLPCLFCRHFELCNLWKDGRETCSSFSR